MAVREHTPEELDEIYDGQREDMAVDQKVSKWMRKHGPMRDGELVESKPVAIPLQAIEAQALAAYKADDRAIPDSDLDDEQPLTLHVRTTLGEVRRIWRLKGMLERAAADAAKREKAERDYDASL